MPEKSIQDKAKQAAGIAAANLIEDGMTIGIGTGSTVTFFIARLKERCREGLRIAAIATSRQTLELARQCNIPLLDEDNISSLDLAVDGADEMDPKKQMIKGGGGALLREKIVACMAKDTLFIIDEKKKVQSLGAFPLPVEISAFCHMATLKHLQDAGFDPHIRKRSNQLFITDNGNYIADLHFKMPLRDPEKTDLQLKKIPGVLETGLFLNVAKKVIIGNFDGTITTLK